MQTTLDVYQRIERRMATVDTSDPDACHEWPGARTDGYGMVAVSYQGKRTTKDRVTRLLLGRERGTALSPDEDALHSCDNPPCVNLAHLRVGSAQENAADAAARGRLPFGERHPHARLTEHQVRAILADDRPLRTVAAEYGVTDMTIHKIRAGRSWRHVPRHPKGNQ